MTTAFPSRTSSGSPSFRATRRVGTDRGHPRLDHQPRARAGGPFDAEAQMIVSAAFRGKRYAVFGLARSGLAAARALVASGADVIAWDDNEAARPVARKSVV